jgi:hypothetical protein
VAVFASFLWVLEDFLDLESFGLKSVMEEEEEEEEVRLKIVCSSKSKSRFILPFQGMTNKISGSGLSRT